MQGLQQHAVGIAMHDPLDRRARLVADRVGELLRRDLGLAHIGHELPRDRIVRQIAAVDQADHLGRDRDRHRLAASASRASCATRPSRSSASRDRRVCMAP
jgi:hypothetical protein